VPQLPEHKSRNDSSLSLWLKQSDKQLTLVVFTADWAGSVAILKGFLNRILEEMPGIAVHWIDIETNQELSLSFGILPRRKLADRMSQHL